MKSTTRGILVLIMVCLPSIVAESSEKTLICYICYSTKSWEHCRRDQRVDYCPKGEDDVCVTIINSRWEYTNTTRYAKGEFAKHCSAADSCTDKRCTEDGSRCNVKCCHTDYCNEGTVVTFSSNVQGRVTDHTAIVFLALSIIVSSTSF